jgi:DNA-binding NarL/FixJ family response regulator
MATRILIVDDHELVRYALRTVLEAEADMEIVGEAPNGEDALRLLADVGVDVVLLDLRMPGMGGVATCRRIAEHDGDVRVLVLTSYDDDDEVFGALTAGASGYLMKDVSPDVLVQSVRGVADGQTVLDSAVARRVIGSHAPHEEAPSEQLSSREMDVLALMAKGMTNRAIAHALWISEPTVKTHVSHILRKLGQSDRTQAVLAALRRGIVKMPAESRSAVPEE